MSDSRTGSSRLGGVKTLKVGGFLDEFEKGDLKSRIDLVSLFREFGVHPKKKGRSYMAQCPWHDDSTPSLSIDREKGLYNCFGCGESGDIFDLVMKQKGVSFKEALSFLKDYAGNKSIPPQKKEVPKEKKEPQNAIKVSAPTTSTQESFSNDVTLQGVMGYYQRALRENISAVEYLKGRGIIDYSVLNHFSIGYCAGDISGAISHEQRDALTELGILTDKGGEAFKECVVIPLYDENGVVTGLYGRKIAGKSRLKHLYLKGPHRGILNRKAFSVYKEELLLTESLIDSLSLFQLGMENVSSLYGTNGLTDEMITALRNSRVKLVTLALDNDEPGRSASEKHKATLLGEGFCVRTIFPPNEKDWNDFLKSGGKREEIRNLLSSSPVDFPESEPVGFLVVRDNSKYIVTTPQVTYRILGAKDSFSTSLKVNIRAERAGQRYIDNVDLFSARSRNSYAGALSRMFDLESARVGADLIRLLDHLEAEKARAEVYDELGVTSLTDEERALGLEFLTDKNLFERLIEDTEALGYVGEELNKLLIYIAASSRKLSGPISVMVVSQSASGKSYLIDTIKKLIPDEDVVSLTSLSDQALNYLPAGGLENKFLVMGEAVHSEVVEHQVREMLSAGELSRLVTVKDEKTGKMISRTVRTKAVVSAVMSSTRLDINHENLSRFFVVNTDESPDQTRRIHQAQRQKYSLARYRQKEEQVPRIIVTHQAAQRLLSQKIIVNPFAEVLTFPDNLMRSRRDHERFVDLIACVCHLRQFQKEEKQMDGLFYIECDLDDYKVAYRIMCGILPMTFSNVPHTAVALYEQVRTLASRKAKSESLKTEEVRLTQREIREESSIGQRTVKKYLKLLVDYEYLHVSGLKVRGSRNSYSLVKDEDLHLVDLSSLPAPEEVKAKLENLQSGASG